MTTYQVQAKPWERGWELHIDGVGVTQCYQVDDAEDTVRDYISLMLDVPADSFGVDLDGWTMAGLQAEKVAENYQPEPGQMDTRTFWIVYPGHVAAYGHMEDRISRAYGTGATITEAFLGAGIRPDGTREG